MFEHIQLTYAPETQDNPTANLDLEQDSTEDTTDTKPLCRPCDSVAEIQDYIRGAEKHCDLLGNLPLAEDYIFDEAPADRPHNYHAEMLFLGEAYGVQSWANLREVQHGEGVVFYNYHTSDVKWMQERNLEDLHLAYPFQALKEFRSKGMDYLAGVVRYVYRETLKVDRTFATSALLNLLVALRQVRSDYDSQGGESYDNYRLVCLTHDVTGARCVEDMQQPSTLPSAKYVRSAASTPGSGTVIPVLAEKYPTPRSPIAGEKHPHDEEDIEMAEENESDTFQDLQTKRQNGREKRAKLKAHIRSLEEVVQSSKQEFDALVEQDNKLRESQKEILRATGRWMFH